MPSPCPRTFLRQKLRPEALLLLCCARTHISSEDARQIQVLAGQPLDWEFLCDSTDKHHLTQLMFRNLSAICPDRIPAEYHARLRHQFRTNAGSNLKMAHALTRLLQTFAAETIPVIPFKGSVLANCTYGKVALRQNYDLDLFIREQDIDRSGDLLMAEGYHRDRLFDREVRYRNDETDVEVDLHWGFTPRYFHHDVVFDELYGRARDESLLGQPIITFSAEDFLQILCLQVIKDGWERRQQLEHLSKVCDIAEHLRAHPDLDWAQLLQQGRDQGLLRIIHSSLILAHELLGAQLPLPVLEEIQSDRKAQKCAQWLCRSLFTEADTMSPLGNPYFSMGLRLRQLIFYMSIRERYHDRLRHIGEILRFWRGP